jgi:hypothetical protein
MMAQATSFPVTNPCASPPLVFDVLTTFQIMKADRLPAVAAAHGQEAIDILHNFAPLHFLCTISAKAA